METRKRRKLGEAAAPAASKGPAMSAFALRQQLLKSTGTVAQPETPCEDGEPTPSIAEKGTLETPVSMGPSLASSRASPEPAQQVESNERIVQLSSFKPSKQNFHQNASGGVAVVKLAEGERIVLLGSYGLKVREGLVTVAGATLQAKSDIAWAHSPLCHALPVVRCSEDATIELYDHPAASNMRGLGLLSPKFDRLWNEDITAMSEQGKTKPPKAPSYDILYTTQDGPRSALIQDLSSPPEWNKKLAALAAASRKATSLTVLVCGPKSSGKSTFGKLLANRLVTDMGKRSGRTGVAVLDIDPGQPEFGPPGVLSLVYVEAPILEPPFCHPCAVPSQKRARILRSHATAAISPITNPEHYTECVLDLFASYTRYLSRKCALVINTCGWVQGTGLNIITDLVNRIRPTEVVYMSEEGPEETVEALREACVKTPMTLLPSQSCKLTARTAADLRTMQMMSYFHVDPSALAAGHLDWITTPLTALSPWSVQYSGPGKAIVGILCYDYEPSPDMLAPLIDGMILAIVEVENMAAFRDLSSAYGAAQKLDNNNSEGMEIDGDPVDDGEAAEEVGTIVPTCQTPEGLPLIQNHKGMTLDPRHSRTIGLALVRGIEERTGTLQLLTPVPADIITQLGAEGARRVVLVWGKLDGAPTWSYVEQQHRQDSGTRAGPGGFGGNDKAARRSSKTDGLCFPWVESLQANEKRSTGSKALRVRRDLGRSAKSTD